MEGNVKLIDANADELRKATGELVEKMTELMSAIEKFNV